MKNNQQVTFKTIPHKSNRYDTIGDWQVKGNSLLITSSKLKTSDYELLIKLHEFIEVVLCQRDKISQASVDAFDMAYKGRGEPGNHPRAPYRSQHKLATKIERLLAKHLGIDWKAYNKNVDEVFDKGR